MGSQRVGHDWATELNWTECLSVTKCKKLEFFSVTWTGPADFSITTLFTYVCLTLFFFSKELHFPTVHIPFHAPVFALQFPLWRCPSLPLTSCKVLSSFKSQVKVPFSSQRFAPMLSHFTHLHVIISCVSVCDSPTRLPLLCNRSCIVCMLSSNFIELHSSEPWNPTATGSYASPSTYNCMTRTGFTFRFLTHEIKITVI